MLNIFFYNICAAICAISIFLFIYARKNIKNCKNEEEEKIVKSKIRIICGIFGAISIALVLIIGFITILI